MPETKVEKFSMTYCHLSFIDSLIFMNTPSAKIAKTLKYSFFENFEIDFGDQWELVKNKTVV